MCILLEQHYNLGNFGGNFDNSIVEKIVDERSIIFAS